MQADLKSKRDVVKRLQTRLHELEQQGDDEESGDEEEEEGNNDQDVNIEKAHEAIESGLLSSANDGHGHVSFHNSQDASTTIDSSLRQRGKSTTTNYPPSTTATTATDISPSTSSSRRPHEPITSREKALTSDRVEQDRIQSSLLKLTQDLKASQVTFQTGLENERSLLDRATKGLDSNVTGMDAAGKTMGRLRMMTEGKGWWGRIQLYVYIAVLWVALLLLVFVMPKLRF